MKINNSISSMHSIGDIAIKRKVGYQEEDDVSRARKRFSLLNVKDDGMVQ
jgi:hypothetical protein